MSRVTILIQTYGDWDMLSGGVVMLAPVGMGKKQAFKLADELADKFSKSEDVEPVIRLLKDMGFETCNTQSLAIGGEL